MACVHLQQLYQLCQQHDLRFQLSGSDLVRLVCNECGSQDVCPSVLTDRNESRQPDTAEGEDREHEENRLP